MLCLYVRRIERRRATQRRKGDRVLRTRRSIVQHEEHGAGLLQEPLVHTGLDAAGADCATMHILLLQGDVVPRRTSKVPRNRPWIISSPASLSFSRSDHRDTSGRVGSSCISSRLQRGVEDVLGVPSFDYSHGGHCIQFTWTVRDLHAAPLRRT